MGRPRIWESDADRKADYRRRKREDGETSYLFREAERQRAYRARLAGDTGKGSAAYDWEVKKLLGVCIDARRKMGQRHRDDPGDREGVVTMLRDIQFAMEKAKEMAPGLGAELDPLLKECRKAGWHLRSHDRDLLALELACVFEDVEDRLNQLMGRKKPRTMELDQLPGYREYRAQRKRQRKL